MSALAKIRSEPRPSGDPNVAALLTWLLPGAGHFYLGRPVFGLVALGVVEGLYLLGLKLSDWRVLELLQDDLRTRFAAALTPEAGNLGGVLLQMRVHGFGDPLRPLPWPDAIELGGMLTAVSGILNVCLMVRAHVDARLGERRVPAREHPATHVLLAWLVPGLGHWVQGRRLRALLVFGTLVGLFALGVALADGSNLDRERHFYYWGGQLLLGLPAILAEQVHGHAPVVGPIPYVDAGLVFGSVAGLLNVLMMIDVFGVAERRALAAEGPAGAAAAPAGPEGGA